MLDTCLLFGSYLRRKTTILDESLKTLVSRPHSWPLLSSLPVSSVFSGWKELIFLSSLLNFMVGKLGPRKRNGLAKAAQLRMERWSQTRVSNLLTGGRHPSHFYTIPIAQLQNSNPSLTAQCGNQPGRVTGRREMLLLQKKKEFRIISTQGYKAERTPGSEGQGYAKMPQVP